MTTDCSSTDKITIKVRDKIRIQEDDEESAAQTQCCKDYFRIIVQESN